MHFHTIIEILDQVCTWKVIWNLKLMNKDLAYRNWSKVALYIWNWLVLPLSPSPFESTSKKLLMSNSWLIQACNRKATKCCYFANMPGGTRVPISRDQTCMADIVNWKLTATTICLNWVCDSQEWKDRGHLMTESGNPQNPYTHYSKIIWCSLTGILFLISSPWMNYFRVCKQMGW